MNLRTIAAGMTGAILFGLPLLVSAAGPAAQSSASACANVAGVSLPVNCGSVSVAVTHEFKGRLSNGNVYVNLEFLAGASASEWLLDGQADAHLTHSQINVVNYATDCERPWIDPDATLRWTGMLLLGTGGDSVQWDCRVYYELPFGACGGAGVRVTANFPSGLLEPGRQTASDGFSTCNP